MSNYRWKTTEKEERPLTPPAPLLKPAPFIAVWIGANFAGLVSGFFLYAITAELLVGAIAMGLIIGWIEMLALTLQRARVGWLWVINSIVAFMTWGMALPVFGAVNGLSGLSLGVVLGLMQWLTLRKHVEQAQWWLAANLVAWIGGLTLYLPLASISWIIGAAVAGLVAGAILGGTLVWLLQRPIWIPKDETPLKDNFQS